MSTSTANSRFGIRIKSYSQHEESVLMYLCSNKYQDRKNINEKNKREVIKIQVLIIKIQVLKAGGNIAVTVKQYLCSSYRGNKYYLLY